MNDDADILNELELDVEAQGGARLAEKHAPLRQVISYPGGKDQQVQTAGCGQHTLFIAPYEFPSKGNLAEDRMITLCAYCDQMPLMARFSGPPD